MYRWFWKCGRLFFGCGQITLRAISRDILRGPRIFWPLNCCFVKASKLDLIEQVARAMNLTSEKEMKSLKEVLFPSLLCSGRLCNHPLTNTPQDVYGQQTLPHNQGVTKRCRRLSWLTNSGKGMSCGVSANVQLCTKSTNKLWRSNSIFNLCFQCSSTCSVIQDRVRTWIYSDLECLIFQIRIWIILLLIRTN